MQFSLLMPCLPRQCCCVNTALHVLQRTIGQIRVLARAPAWWPHTTDLLTITARKTGPTAMANVLLERASCSCHTASVATCHLPRASWSYCAASSDGSQVAEQQRLITQLQDEVDEHHQ